MLQFYDDLKKSEKRLWQVLALLFAVLVSLFTASLIASYGFSAWQEWRALRGAVLQVSVSGEGKVSAKPDVARVSATILTEAEDLKSAQNENAQKSNALSAYLKGAGLAERDIRTAGYTIFPQYRYPRPCFGESCPAEDRPRIIGYQVRNTFELTIRDIAKASEVLAGAVSAGANEVSGISFTIDKPEALKAEARREAIANAESKAKALAKDLGRRVGRITAFSEGGGFPPPFALGREAAFDGKGGDGATAVEPGENEVVVTVNITYEFK